MIAIAAIATVHARADEPIKKAQAYLAIEVPQWPRENRCFSCHNNGDAARALYRTNGPHSQHLETTTRWLEDPAKWDSKRDDGPSSDKKLARIQFSLALVSAIEGGASKHRGALKIAADLVVSDLNRDGSAPLIDGGTIGSPATYGPRFGTALVVKILRSADAIKYANLIKKAESYVRSKPIENLLDAVSVLMVEADPPQVLSPKAVVALQYLREAQTKSGGWGPYRAVPTEPFDTAVALLVLQRFREDLRVVAAIRSGRNALIAMQLEDGSFPPTTRPPGGESYAQKLSTTGWATLALIETEQR
jgi:hypothetical protein